MVLLRLYISSDQFSISPIFQPLLTANLLCFCKLNILDSTYKCNHTVFVFLCLTYLTKHNDFKVHLRLHKWQNSLFYSWIIVLYIYILYIYIMSYFLYSLYINGHLDSQVASISWLLWIMLKWTWEYRYIFEMLFLFP